jgi:hypothetical protein
VRQVSASGRLAFSMSIALAAAVVGVEVWSQSAESATAPKLYAPTSPLNRPIPADAGVDPNSDSMVRQLVGEVGERGWVVSSKEYTVPIFYAGPKTPRHAVSVGVLGKKAYGVPIPPGAFPSPGTDRHMVVIDRARGCEYDFYLAERLAGGSWRAQLLNSVSTRGSGIFPKGLGARASGFAAAAGLITAEELRAGAIEHALVFTMRETKAGGPVHPATSSDGRSGSPGAIPQGARLQLDPGLDLDSLPLSRWQKIVARALQRYGMYLADTGGAVALFAQHSATVLPRRYPWGEATYADLPSWLAQHLRVLRLPRQQPSVHRLVRTPCLRIG